MEGARDAKGLATVINTSLMQAFAISCLFNCCSALRTVYMEGIGQRQRAVFQRCTGNFTVVVYALVVSCDSRCFCVLFDVLRIMVQAMLL